MRPFGFLIACIAVLAMLGSPAGFMPARASDGAIIIKVCNEAGSPRAKITADNPLYASLVQDQLLDNENDDTTDCDYQSVDPSDYPSLQSLSERQALRVLPEAFSFSVLTGIFPSGLPPATGPPA